MTKIQSELFAVRFTSAERSAIEASAIANGVSMGTVIRWAIHSQLISPDGEVGILEIGGYPSHAVNVRRVKQNTVTA